MALQSGYFITKIRMLLHIVVHTLYTLYWVNNNCHSSRGEGFKALLSADVHS